MCIVLCHPGKEEFLKEVGPFLYVGFLCTAPSNQGQGLGSQLLSHLLAKADALGKHAYLEVRRHGAVLRAFEWMQPLVVACFVHTQAQKRGVKLSGC